MFLNMGIALFCRQRCIVLLMEAPAVDRGIWLLTERGIWWLLMKVMAWLKTDVVWLLMEVLCGYMEWTDVV